MNQNRLIFYHIQTLPPSYAPQVERNKCFWLKNNKLEIIGDQLPTEVSFKLKVNFIDCSFYKSMRLIQQFEGIQLMNQPTNYQMLCLCRSLTLISLKWRFATQLQKGFVAQTEHRDNGEKRNSHVHIGKILFAYCGKVVQEQRHLSDECVNLIPTTKFRAQLASVLTTNMHQKACIQMVNAECWVELEHDRITVSILISKNTSLLSKSNGYQRNRIQIKHRRSKYHWLLTQFHSRLRYLKVSFPWTENPKVVI